MTLYLWIYNLYPMSEQCRSRFGCLIWFYSILILVRNNLMDFKRSGIDPDQTAQIWMYTSQPWIHILCNDNHCTIHVKLEPVNCYICDQCRPKSAHTAYGLFRFIIQLSKIHTNKPASEK